MKKSKFKYLMALVSLVSVLVLSLAGCKQFKLDNTFKDTFGQSEYIGDSNYLVKVKPDMNVLDALQIVNSNFDAYPYVASRGIVKGTTVGGKIKTHQTIYSTLIKEKDALGNYKIYHEDASVSNASLFVTNSAVRVMQKIDNKGLAKTNVRLYLDDKVISTDEAYPEIKDKYEAKQYNTMDEYLKDYHQDISKLLVFTLNTSTVDTALSSVKENGKFIDVVVKVKNDASALKTASVVKRSMIALKSSYSGIQCDPEKVNFTELTITIKLWKSGYIRSVEVNESYNMDVHMQNIGDMHQECNGFVSTYYFSNDPLELPMKEFEF